jgi:hypothetical protein
MSLEQPFRNCEHYAIPSTPNSYAFLSANRVHAVYHANSDLPASHCDKVQRQCDPGAAPKQQSVGLGIHVGNLVRVLH